MKRYDPERPPVAEAWLGLDEATRIDLVESYHRRARVKLPKPRLHAALHTVVENQLAEHIVEVESALGRLMAEGLGRHDAVHAISWVLIEEFIDAREAIPARVDMSQQYLRRLETLTAQEWLASVGPAPS
jgi:hypothetical protein